MYWGWVWWHQLLLLPEEAAGVCRPKQVSNARWSAKRWKNHGKTWWKYGTNGPAKVAIHGGRSWVSHLPSWRVPVSQSPVGKGLLINMGKLESARNAGLTIHRCTSSPLLQQFLAQVGLLLFFPLVQIWIWPGKMIPVPTPKSLGILSPTGNLWWGCYGVYSFLSSKVVYGTPLVYVDECRSFSKENNGFLYYSSLPEARYILWQVMTSTFLHATAPAGYR